MTLARLLCCTTALALAACATPGRAHEPTTPTPSSYQLCADPAFESMCKAPSVTAPTDTIRVDTNLTTPPTPRASHAA